MVAAPFNFMLIAYNTTKMAVKFDLDRGGMRQFEGLFATLPSGALLDTLNNYLLYNQYMKIPVSGYWGGWVVNLPLLY
jgi:hypothetical protein